MVAGMLMPLEDLRSIYEVLFRDGVMVAKKDRRPQCMHPDVQGVSNLKVIRAMGSLKSSGFVRETFAWRHSYWYLTNEGIAHVRDFLHLPPEIIPSTLQRVRSTVSTLHPAHRAAHVQRIKGPTSFVPKSRTKEEHQEDVLDRQGYRSKRSLSKEPETQPEKMAMSFRGSYAPKFPEKEAAHQKQRFGHSPDSFREEERVTAKNLNRYSSTSYSNMASRAVHSASKEVKIVTPISKQQEEPEASQPDVPEQEISAAKPDSWKTNQSIKAAQSFIAPAEECITNPTEIMKMDIPVPLVEAVKEDLFIAQAEPVGEMLDVGSVQKCMEMASDQVSTDSVALVEEGAGQQMQEQSDPDICADTDAPLTVPPAPPVDNDQSTVNQVVQEWQIFEPKEPKETLKVLEEPLYEEKVMMVTSAELQPAAGFTCIYLHETGKPDEEVTEVQQEMPVAEDVEELSSQMTHEDANIDVTSVEETIDAEHAVANEKVLQMPVVDDWLIVSHSHDEPKGGEQVHDEVGLHQPLESAEFGEQSKQLEAMLVQEETIHAVDVMEAMDALKISSGDASAAAQDILKEDLSEITELEPPVEESATNTSAVTSVVPEESLTAVSNNLLLTQFSPETDPYVDPSVLEVQDTAVLHAAVNVEPPSEDLTVLHPGATVIQSSEEVDEGVAEHPVQELPLED